MPLQPEQGREDKGLQASIIAAANRCQNAVEILRDGIAEDAKWGLARFGNDPEQQWVRPDLSELGQQEDREDVAEIGLISGVAGWILGNTLQDRQQVRRDLIVLRRARRGGRGGRKRKPKHPATDAFFGALVRWRRWRRARRRLRPLLGAGLAGVAGSA